MMKSRGLIIADEQKAINSNFKKRLDKLLMEHPNVDIAAMWFPNDWKNEPFWK